MIDIIIPAYNSHKTIKNTLLSIAYQKNKKDITVYIIDDASEKDYSSEINFFKNFLNIKQLKLESNCGPGLARQYGIDHSNNPYIIFIDSDDIFASPIEVSLLYENIVQNNCDVVISSFIEETQNEDILHTNDVGCIHGKIYKRSFLEKNSISFNSTRICEDSGFNRLILLHDAKIKYIEDITTFWRYNSNSITRKNNGQDFPLFVEAFIYNMFDVLKKSIEHNCNSNTIALQSYKILVNIYGFFIELFENNFNTSNILLDTKDILKIYLNHPINDTNTKKELLDKELISFNFEDKLLKHPPISFNSFIEKIENLF